MDDTQIMKLMDKLSELSERMARVETMLQANHDSDKAIAKTLADNDERNSIDKSSKMRYRSISMSNLDWEDLQRRFYDYFYTARRLGFYVPELQRQEKSLMECCPYPRRKDDVK